MKTGSFKIKVLELGHIMVYWINKTCWSGIPFWEYFFMKCVIISGHLNYLQQTRTFKHFCIIKYINWTNFMCPLKYYKHQVVNYKLSTTNFQILVLVIKRLCHKSRQCNMVLTPGTNNHHYKTLSQKQANTGSCSTVKYKISTYT
jgi:hypothetical protein